MNYVAFPFYPDKASYEAAMGLLPVTAENEFKPYPEWKGLIPVFEEGYRRAGQIPVRINVVASEVECWVHRNGIPVDFLMFGRYAAHKLADRVSSGDLGVTG